MKNNKIILIGFFILAILIITLLFFKNHREPKVQNAESETPETEVIRIGYQPLMFILPFWTAKEKGYFEKENISIEVTKMESASQLMDALASGRIDLAFGLSPEPAIAAESKFPGTLKIILMNNIPLEGDALVVSSKSEISTLAQLEGKKIGIHPSPTPEVLLKIFFQRNGINADKIQFIQIPPPNQLNALEAGSIDALYAIQPTKTVGKVKKMTRAIKDGVFAEMIDPLYLGLAAFSGDFAKKNPQTVEKVRRVLEESLQFINSDPEEARKLMADYSSVPKDIIDEMGFVPKNSVPEDADLGKFQEFSDLLFENKIIEQKVDVSTIIYNP